MTVLEIVERERARLRALDAAGAVAIAIFASVAIVGLAAWLLGDARWLALPRAVPLLAWAVLLAVNAAVALRAARRWRRDLARASVAAVIEREQTLRAGVLRGVMELGDTNVFSRRLDRSLAERLASGPALAPAMHRAARTRALRGAGIAAVTLALLFGAAPSLGDGLLAFRRPIAAWRGTLMPAIAFDQLPPELLRGDALDVTLRAPGRRTVELRSRATGEGWRGVALTVDSVTGLARASFGSVRGDLMLLASDGRSTTDTMMVRVTDRPFVGGVVLRATYPAYLERLAEGLPLGEVARVPRGTVIDVEGRASTALSSVTLVQGDGAVRLAVAGQTFRGRLLPSASGTWTWSAGGPRGPIADVPLPIEIEVIADSVPRVELVSPATDTVIATTDRVQLEVTAADDHGIGLVELHSVRHPAGGRAESPVAQRVAETQGAVWNGTPVVELSARELKPGDALRVRVVAVDNSPWAQRGESRELVLRVPTMEERRSLVREAADSAANAAVSAVAQQKALEQRTEQASRERGNRDQNSPGNASAAASREQREREMSFESAEKARALAQEQRSLTDKVERLKDAAAKLEEQLRQAQALDSSLARQLREAQDLLRQALTPEMMQQMENLENATRDLEGDRARDALKDLAEMQKRLREQLEKSAEMLKRAAIEGAMETLKDEAQEIAEGQRQLADSGSRMSPEGREQQGTELADRSERLSNDMEQMRDRLSKEKADAAAQRAGSAQENASASEQSMRQNDAGKASQQMEQAARDMEAARDQQVGEWKKELTDALDESIQELLQMAKQESALEEQARQAGQDPQKMEQLRGQQSAVKQGMDRTSERMQKEGQKSSLVSGRAQRAMSEASQRIEQAMQQMSQPRGGQQTANSLGEAAEALNRAAASLARDRERANTASSATGFAEMMQQLQEMAKKQGNINAQAQGLMPMPGQQQMSADAQATARALARQQRNIANQLEEIGDAAGGDRAGELAREARQLAEALEQTRVDAATLARQQQLFRRLLDAGRSLEKEEREDDQAKREATSARGDQRFTPEGDAASGRAANRFEAPAWSDLRGLTADERRAILEYFKRINAPRP